MSETKLSSDILVLAVLLSSGYPGNFSLRFETGSSFYCIPLLLHTTPTDNFYSPIISLFSEPKPWTVTFMNVSQFVWFFLP